MPESTQSHLPGPHPRYYNFTMKVGMGPLLSMYGGLEHRGAEILTELSGPVIIAPNHRSMLDTPIVAQAALEAADTHVHFMAKSELWKVPGLGKLIEWGGGFKVDRSNQNKTPEETKKHIDFLLIHDGVIGVFPEATRRTGPSINVQHLVGVPILASESGASVVPVGIAGTEKGERKPFKAIFGEPIFVEPANNRKELVSQAKFVKQILHARMQELFDAANQWSDKSLTSHRGNLRK